MESLGRAKSAVEIAIQNILADSEGLSSNLVAITAERDQLRAEVDKLKTVASPINGELNLLKWKSPNSDKSNRAAFSPQKNEDTVISSPYSFGNHKIPDSNQYNAVQNSKTGETISRNKDMYGACNDHLSNGTQSFVSYWRNTVEESNSDQRESPGHTNGIASPQQPQLNNRNSLRRN